MNYKYATKRSFYFEIDYKLDREFGDKLTFCGGIIVQKTIPSGKPVDVVNEVKNRIDIF